MAARVQICAVNSFFPFPGKKLFLLLFSLVLALGFTLGTGTGSVDTALVQ